jgi:hypothetical protein
MNHYVWIVWKDCRLAGYIKAYSEREAVLKSKEKFGERTFVERTIWSEDFRVEEASMVGSAKD